MRGGSIRVSGIRRGGIGRGGIGRGGSGGYGGSGRGEPGMASRGAEAERNDWQRAPGVLGFGPARRDLGVRRGQFTQQSLGCIDRRAEPRGAGQRGTC
eukprot:scaffold14858_cov27-Tisochrysis_lutea.AAC.1